MSVPEDAKKVELYMDRIRKVSERYLQRLAEREGVTVALSVTANIATDHFAIVLLMIQSQGGDITEFADMMMELVRRKVVAEADFEHILIKSKQSTKH
jgi:hypothetical protein